MVDKAIIIENKLKEMEKNGKRKISLQGQSLGSNTRPRLPQPGHFIRALQMMCSLIKGRRHLFPMQQPNPPMQRPSFQMQHSQ
jgi:hypothetical protein